MKFTKLILITIISVLIINTVFACAVYNVAQGISCNPCNNETKICECSVTTTYIHENFTEPSDKVLFTTQDNCQDYNINLYLNSKNLILKSSLSENFNSGSLLHWNLIVNGTSVISIYNEKPLNVHFSNIVVNPGAILNIQTGYDLPKANINIDFSAKDIFVSNNSILNINLKTNDGPHGHTLSEDCSDHANTAGDDNPGGDDGCDDGEGTGGQSSGDLNFFTSKIENYGNIEMQLQTGNGGNGGNGRGDGGNNARHGGNGRDSGDIFFELKNIKNYNSLNLYLITKNGGNGGDTGIDEKYDNEFIGGDGGSAGNINIDSISQIENLGQLLFSAIAGNGGLGGAQRSDSHNDYENCNNGKSGAGGSGGSINSDLNIGTIINKSNDFKIIFKSGTFGKINLNKCSTNRDEWTQGEGQYFGFPGHLGNINIDFLDNKNSNGIEISSNLNFSQEDYMLAFIAQENNGNDKAINGGNMRGLSTLGLKTTNIYINNLSNGSYLPKFINIISEPTDVQYFSNNININGCYVQPSNISYSLNGAAEIFATNTSALNSYLPVGTATTYRYCPHCEITPLDDTYNRYTRNYSVFSDINGTINIGDLNIYYSDPANQTIYYTKRTDNKQLPVYRNKNPIQGIWNNKVNSFEYTITPIDLNYYSYSPEEDTSNLNTEDNLFCYGQEYKIDGKIKTSSGDQHFNFPFVPLREQFFNN